MKRSKIVYIETNDAGRPCQTVAQVLSDVVNNACLDSVDRSYVGLVSRSGKGRRKVRITITVEPLRS